MPRFISQIVLGAFLLNGFVCPCLAAATEDVESAPAAHAHHGAGHEQAMEAGSDCPSPETADCCASLTSASPHSKQAMSTDVRTDTEDDDSTCCDRARPAAPSAAGPPGLVSIDAVILSVTTPVASFDKQSK